MPDFSIRNAYFPDDTAAILDIWREYVASPSVSLAYQNNDAEFANLPGKYQAPMGRVILAEQAGNILGCIAFRKIDDRICEMKRLYVRQSARGQQLGQKLVERMIAEAKGAGYAEIRLDVLEEFTAAQQLYRDFGFAPADPVSFNPLPGTQFLGLTIG